MFRSLAGISDIRKVRSSFQDRSPQTPGMQLERNQNKVRCYKNYLNIFIRNHVLRDNRSKLNHVNPVFFKQLQVNRKLIKIKYIPTSHF